MTWMNKPRPAEDAFEPVSSNDASNYLDDGSIEFGSGDANPSEAITAKNNKEKKPAWHHRMPSNPGLIEKSDQVLSSSESVPASLRSSVDPESDLLRRQGAFSEQHERMWNTPTTSQNEIPRTPPSSEQLSAPTERRPKQQNVDHHPDSEVPEKSGVYRKKSTTRAGATIVARGTFQEVENPAPNTFRTRGGLPVTGDLSLPPHAPSVMEDLDEDVKTVKRLLHIIEEKGQRVTKPRKAA